jgi:transcriptional regulator with XRE-family HTH domain
LEAEEDMSEETEGRRPNPVDLHVGGRVRMRRKLLGVSQEQLADALGLTFQQVQKYERGANRVSASKLYEIAKTLQVPVSFFFDGLADPMNDVEMDDASLRAERVVQEFLTTSEGLEDTTQVRRLFGQTPISVKRSPSRKMLYF